MKKTLITSLIATSLLVACGDKGTESTKELTSIAANNMAAPERAEQTFKASTEAGNDYYQIMFSSHPLIKSVDYTLESYEKGDMSAQAKTKFTIELSSGLADENSHDLLISHDIKYDQAVIDSGLISSTTSKVIKPEEVSDDYKFFAELMPYFHYKTDISKDELFSQIATFDAFTAPDNEFEFKGFEQHYTGQLDEIGNGFGEYKFNFKGMNTDDGFTVDALNANCYYKNNGDFNFKTTTPLTMGEEGFSATIESVTAKGNLLYDKAVKLFFGDAEYQVNNIQITNEDLPNPIAIDSIIANTSSKMSDKKLLSSTMNLIIKPQEGVVSSLSQGMLDASELTVNGSMKDFPVQIMADYEDFLNVMMEQSVSDTEEAEEAMEQKVEVMFDTAKAAGSSMKFDMVLTTSEGNITSDASISFNPKSDVSFDALKEEPSSASISSLLKVNAQVKVPAVLLEKTGMQMMAGPYLKKTGDYYEAVLTNESGAFLINDIPAPLPF